MEGIMAGVGATFVAVLLLWLSASLGGTLTQRDITTSCDKAGVVLISGRVYDCKARV